jgi:hypothetical protein
MKKVYLLVGVFCLLLFILNAAANETSEKSEKDALEYEEEMKKLSDAGLNIATDNNPDGVTADDVSISEDGTTIIIKNPSKTIDLSKVKGGFRIKSDKGAIIDDIEFNHYIIGPDSHIMVKDGRIHFLGPISLEEGSILSDQEVSGSFSNVNFECIGVFCKSILSTEPGKNVKINGAIIKGESYMSISIYGPITSIYSEGLVNMIYDDFDIDFKGEFSLLNDETAKPKIRTLSIEGTERTLGYLKIKSPKGIEVESRSKFVFYTNSDEYQSSVLSKNPENIAFIGDRDILLNINEFDDSLKFRLQDGDFKNIIVDPIYEYKDSFFKIDIMDNDNVKTSIMVRHDSVGITGDLSIKSSFFTSFKKDLDIIPFGLFSSNNQFTGKVLQGTELFNILLESPTEENLYLVSSIMNEDILKQGLLNKDYKAIFQNMEYNERKRLLESMDISELQRNSFEFLLSDNPDEWKNIISHGISSDVFNHYLSLSDEKRKVLIDEIDVIQLDIFKASILIERLYSDYEDKQMVSQFISKLDLGILNPHLEEIIDFISRDFFTPADREKLLNIFESQDIVIP